MSAPKKAPKDFFEIRLRSVATEIPLPFDLFLVVNGKPVLFRRRTDVITEDRMKLLVRHGGEKFLVPESQRIPYMKSIKDVIANPSTPTDIKSRFIKESAFVHVHDLFTKEDLSPVISETKSLVEEMVSFVSTDVEAITSLMRLSVHDYYTYNHCVDVAVYSIALAKKILGEDKKLLLLAGLGGLLHDIGKRKLNWDLINKSSPLTQLEWEEIKRHPLYGKESLEKIEAIPVDAKLAVVEHHENFDGTGYPYGLKEEQISRLSRIVTIADVFDALTTDRSYHKAVGPQEALGTMYSMQPGKFDPMIFQSFNKNFAKKGPLKLTADFDPCQPQSLDRFKVG
ncbi:MAG: HD domain-containing protein [Deltaproteobacteria bacterium]|nr:HD domain-containing protein [Deltaproteobacteria bacterium]